MLSKYLLLLFIPMIYANIAIKITAGKTEADTSIEYSGTNVAIISDKEREAFHIQDSQLKDACAKFSGRRPTDVFVKRPTPWEDVYRKFNWNEVKRTLKPVRARILGIHTKPIIVTTRDCINPSVSTKLKCTANISHQIEETVTNTWSKGGELTVGQEIEYSVTYGAGTVGGKTSLSYAATWGNDTSKSKAEILGSTTTGEIEMPPGKSAVLVLTATHGTLDIEVDYEAYLTGDISANYHGKYKGHMWWAYDIKYVMKEAGIPLYVNSTEKISIGYYSSARVEVRDKKTHSMVKLVPAGIISSTSSLPYYNDSYEKQLRQLFYTYLEKS